MALAAEALDANSRRLGECPRRERKRHHADKKK
jgi:hypothetical protein